MSQLNDRQQAFVREYLVDLNGTRAYKMAGYTTKSDAVANAAASRLLSTVKVQAALKEAFAERDEIALHDRLSVIRGLLAVATNGEANDFARIRAWELLGKLIGLWGKDFNLADTLGAALAEVEAALADHRERS